MNRSVFLDRDGVINRALVREGRTYAPRSIDQFELLPGAPEAIASLKAAGFRVIVVTNQPDVAAGTIRREVVEAMHAKIRRECDVDDIRVCYHTDVDRCNCRKPKPGLILDAARDWSVDLSHSYMVGDRWRDIEAGKAAGCRTILIEYDCAEPKAQNPDAVFRSLSEASQFILSVVDEATAPAKASYARP